MSDSAQRVVTTSMIGMEMPDIARWSPSVVVVLGQNPGPFTGPGTNTYIVGTGANRILLDTGQGVVEWVDLVQRALTEHCDDACLERIVVTHAHPDHHGGVRDVFDRFGALPLQKKPWPANDMGLPVEAIDHLDVVSVEGATLEAHWTPGHAEDHLCFLLREERALFTGDVVLGAGTTVIPPDGDLQDYLDSLARLLELDIDVIFPAHGPAIREPHAKIRQYIAHRELRDVQILEAVDAGVHLVQDMVTRIYVDVPAFLHGAAAVSVSSHLRRFAKNAILAEDDGRWVRV
ncbi:MAG: ribonuclease/clavin/mitogillin [Hyphomicrobiaceae bacterium]|jgi:ribonuclease/clavin/mitogillin